MEKPTGKKNKTRTPEAEVHVQKDTAKEEKASGKEQPNQSPTLAQKHRKEARLSPELRGNRVTLLGPIAWLHHLLTGHVI